MHLGTVWSGSMQLMTPFVTMMRWELIHSWTASASLSLVASRGGAASDAATDGGAAAGLAPRLMSHCCTKGGTVLSE